jgi:hypothetical protein
MQKKFGKKTARQKIIFLFLNFNFCCAALAVQQVSLNWQMSSSPDVAGYFVYEGRASGAYNDKLDAGLNSQLTISNLSEGQTYYFAVTAYDAYGDESPPSNEIQYITPGLIIMMDANSQSVSLKFPVESGHWYELQASTDLKNWADIGQTSVAVSNIWLQFTDLQSSQFSQRFYRLVMH